MGQGQKFQLKSVIQSSPMGNFSVLATTQTEGWYLKTQTYIDECSSERGMEDDFMYLYQEMPVLEAPTRTWGRTLSPSAPISPMIGEVIRHAAELGSDLLLGALVRGDGNCAFAAILGNIAINKYK